MAKKAAVPGNKSQAIREALAAHPDKSPKEITELVTAHGLKVTPAYVSIVKYNLSKAGGKKGRKVVVRRKVGRPLEGAVPQLPPAWAPWKRPSRSFRRQAASSRPSRLWRCWSRSRAAL